MEYDFSKIVLLPDELALLKRLVKRSPQSIKPEDESTAASLAIRWKLINPESSGQYSANKNGKRYLVYCKAHRRELWLKNMWIPIIVSFVTTVTTNYITPRIPQILQWVANILSRISS